MKDNFIQLNKDHILRLGIRTVDGKETGEHLEFDLEDIELPLKYQELIEQEKKNRTNFKNQITIIERRQDVKGKKLMSKNEEDKIKALTEFYKKEAEILDGFLGEGGVNKLLNGRKLGWTSLQEIDEIITNQIAPHIKINTDDIIKKVREKYKVSEEAEVLE